MSNKELNKIIKDINNFKKEITSSKSTSIDFLNKAGICNTNGNLKTPYK